MSYAPIPSTIIARVFFRQVASYIPVIVPGMVVSIALIITALVIWCRRWRKSRSRYAGVAMSSAGGVGEHKPPPMYRASVMHELHGRAIEREGVRRLGARDTKPGERLEDYVGWVNIYGQKHFLLRKRVLRLGQIMI